MSKKNLVAIVFVAAAFIMLTVRYFASSYSPFWAFSALFSLFLSLFILVLSWLEDKSDFASLSRDKMRAENDLERLRLTHRVLNLELVESRSQIASLQTSLQATLNELRELKERAYLSDEGRAAHQTLTYQHNQLRKQFEEKTKALAEVRRELFEMEGRYLALQKDKELIVPDDQFSIELGSEINALEFQVSEMEELISSLLAKKKKKKKSDEQGQDLMALFGNE